MTQPSTAPRATPSPARDRCQRLLADFERAWREGAAPRIEDYLPPADAGGIGAGARQELLTELVHADLENRWRKYAPPGASGPPLAFPAFLAAEALPAFPLLEDYVRRYPDLAPLATISVELIGTEYFVRRLWGDQPTRAEYQKRFPHRAAEIAATLAENDADLAREFGQAKTSPEAPPLALPLTDTIGPRPAVPLETTIPCPHCQAPVLSRTNATEVEKTCSSCGGRFSIQPARSAPPVSRIGRYVLDESLGSGAFGCVYKGWDAELRREVAVKLPRGGHRLGAVEEERFLRESRAAAGLRHEGIVPVYDVGRDEAGLYLVSELVRGESLGELLKRERLPFRSTAEVVAQVAEVIDYAHRQGVVHRDLKPSNIMLGAIQDETAAVSGSTWREGGQELLHFRPKVMDFGLAKRADADLTMTLDGDVLGTPAYMSPEQIRDSHGADGRSDVYSLGVILYQLLTGELPFSGPVPLVLEQVQHAEPRRPRRLERRIPGDLETLTLKCLAKVAQRRYPTAGALAQDLRRWLGGEPIRARRAGLVERSWRWAQRNRVVASMAGALALLLVLAAAGSLAAAVRLAHDRDVAVQARRDAEESARLAREAQGQADQNREAAERARQQADQERDLALRTLTTLVDVTDRQLANLPNSQHLRGKILAAAVAEFERMALASEKSGAKKGIVIACTALGNLFVAVGQAAEAQKYYEQGLQAAEELVRAKMPPNLPVQFDLANLRFRLANVVREQGDLAAARRYCQQVREQMEPLVAADANNHEARAMLAHSVGELGEVAQLSGDQDQAEKNGEKARELLETLSTAYPLLYQQALAVAFQRLGRFALERNDLEIAQAWFEKAYQSSLKFRAQYPGNLEPEFGLAQISLYLGKVAQLRGDNPGAAARYEESLQRYRVANGGSDAYNAVSLRGLATCLTNLSEVRLHVGEHDAARQTSLEAVRLMTRLFEWDGRNRMLKEQLANALAQQGRVEALLGLAEGEATLTRVFKLREEVQRSEPNNPTLASKAAVAHYNIGSYFQRLHRHAEAVPWFEGAAERLRQCNTMPQPPRAQGELTASIKTVADHLAVARGASRAVEDLSYVTAQPPRLRLSLLEVRATALVRRGQVAEAVAALEMLDNLAAKDAERQFGIACAYALCATKEEQDDAKKQYCNRAMHALQRSADLGFKDLAQYATDPDLVALRSLPEYLALIKRLKER